MAGFMTKLYLLAGGALMVGYLFIEGRGVVFASTDSKPSVYASSRGRSGTSGRTTRRGRGGAVFWGSGYRGGK